MALPLRISWLCTLLWCWICFPVQRGYHIAHGYHLYENPQTYGQLPSGVPLKMNSEDETQALRHQNFASLKKQSREDVRPAMKLREDTVQSQPDSAHDADEYLVASSTPSGKKHEQSTSDHPHPFSLLMKKHTKDPGKGVSFPSINHLERFIESMKSSFFIPGRDSSRYFQTARETMKNVGESSDAYGSDSVKEETAPLDNSKQEVWRRPGAKFQMPDKPASSNLPNGGLPGGNNELFKGAAENDRAESKNYKQHKQKQFPARSFYGKNSASLVNPPHRPSQDFSYYSGQTSNLPPSTSEQNILEPRSRSRDPLTGYQTPSGFHRVTQADFFHPQKPPNFNSYNKGLYAPRGQHYNKDFLPKHRNINHGSTVYQPASSGTLFSSYNNLFPQRRSGHVGIQTNSPHEPYSLMDRSHLAFPVKPSRFLHGSRGHNSFVGYQKVSDAPSSLTAQARHRQKSDLYNQNLVPTIHRLNDRTMKPLGSFSLPHRRGLSPNDGYVAAMRAGLLQTFMQPTSMQMLQSTVNKMPRNLAYWPSQQLSAPIGSLTKCVNWRNTKGLPSRRAQNGLQSYVNAYLKSKNRFARATAYVSNACYIPYQEATGITAKLNWNMT